MGVDQHESLRANPDVQLVEGKFDKAQISFRYLTRNLISMMGLAGIAFFGQVLLILIILDLTGVLGSENLYGGLITYILMPLLFTLSVLFTAVGMVWKFWRTRKYGMEMTIVPAHTRSGKFFAITVASLITVAWLFVAGFGAYKGYHYTDSTLFCGTACHQIMEPEYTAYQRSPHARVNCVECHIGTGADYYVKAKYHGLKQVWDTYWHTYKTPIKTPIETMRRATETCGHCHWPDRSLGSVERVVTHYATDDANTPTRYKLLIALGGGTSKHTGSHWHISNETEVKYLALDEQRQQIPYVRVTYKNDGHVEEFMTNGFDRSTLNEEKLRTMDCLDCHNRPAHVFNSPDRALNDAMDKGLISPDLPGIKRVAMKALKQEYKTKGEALVSIDAALDAYVKDQKLTAAQNLLLADARAQLKSIYSTNFFPEHNVDYRAFINNMGHFEFKGCERCHDGKHLSTNGKGPITHKCDVCHLLVGQASGADKIKTMQYGLVEFEHPEDPVNLNKTCSSCHAVKKE
jgi:nitrate/TMAO reductase-like tetraheme cytochrome c subunit